MSDDHLVSRLGITLNKSFPQKPRIRADFMNSRARYLSSNLGDMILEYTNLNYRNSLIAILVFLFLLNCYSLFTGNLFAIISILLQGALLITIYLKWSEQRVLIKFWTALLFISGIAGIIGSCAKVVNNSLTEDASLFQDLKLLNLFYNLVCIIISAYYYRMLPKCIKVVEDIETLSNNSTHAS